MKIQKDKPDHNSIVAKDNELIGQMAKFELSELRLIAYCLAHYDSRKPENRSFTARVDELTDIFPMDEKCAYAVIRKAMLGINKKPLQFEKNNKEYFWNWFSGFIYDKAAGEFEFRITPEIQPYLLALKGNFTRYRLGDVYQFKAGSTWKLYELLKRWSGTKYWSVELDELRLLLGVAGKYPTWNNLKQWLINPAIKEINELSDLRITYEKKKRGRRVIGLTFHIDKRQAGYQPDNVITVESDQDTLQQELRKNGVNHTTALDYAQTIGNRGMAKDILAKLPGIVERAKEKSSAEEGKKKETTIPYILGAIKDELNQGQADTAQKPAAPPPAPAPAHREALNCWMEKKRGKEDCKVRERKSSGQRKKCHVCLEKLPIAEWGI